MSQAIAPDQRVDDPEDISQRQRIKEILDRRTELLDARNAARRAYLLDDLNQERALLFYRSELESLIHELWNIFANMYGDEGYKYVSEKELGVVVIHPPESLEQTVKQLDAGAALPEPKTETIEGLVWYLEKPDVLEETFTVRSFDPPGQVSKTAQHILQWRELDAGMRACLEFIDRAGIDADLIDRNKEGKAEYEWAIEKLKNE